MKTTYNKIFELLIKIFSLLTASQRKQTILLLALMIIGMALETIGVGLIIPVIALLTQQDLAANYPLLQDMLILMGNPEQDELIIGTMLALVLIYLIKNLFLAFLAWQQTKFVFSLQTELSQRLFTIYLRQPYTFHLQRNSAQLIRNIHGEVGMFANSAVRPVLLLFTEVLVMIGLSLLMLTVEFTGTLVVIFIMGLSAWLFQRVTKGYVLQWGKARQFHEGMRIQHLHQGLGGTKEVKLLGREADFLDQFGEHTLKSAVVSRKQTALQQIPRLGLEFLAVIGLTCLVLSMLFIGREMATILPTLGLFTAVAFRLMPSVNRVLLAIQQLRFSLPAINTLYFELKLNSYDSSIEKSFKEIAFDNVLTLQDISYAYPSTEKNVLNGISFSLIKGESIGFIGFTGSGKSTLIDIILGLLSPKSGHITIDGKEVSLDQRGWQDKIGYVSQSIYLTDDTLKRNVAFGLSDEQIDDEAVLKAVKAAKLYKFISTLPNGIETVVGERGIRLSGGQRQRIGIARALYHDPEILVLDEATSSLDNETEYEVVQEMKQFKGEKTLIIVAHRLTTVEHCDRIYRLNDGEIVEYGNYDSVVGNNL